MTNLSSSGTFLSGNNASGTSGSHIGGSGPSALSGGEQSAGNSHKMGQVAATVMQQTAKPTAFDAISRLYQNDSNQKAR